MASIVMVMTQMMSAGLGEWWWFGSASTTVTLLLVGGITLTFAGRLAVILVPDDHPVQIGPGQDWPRSLYQCCVRVAGLGGGRCI